MDYKKNIVAGVIIIIIATLVTFAIYKQENSEGEASPFSEEPATTTLQDMQSMPPLPQADEAVLQKQLQEIISKGKEADCDTLNDPRYQFACHDFMKIQKK